MRYRNTLGKKKTKKLVTMVTEEEHKFFKMIALERGMTMGRLLTQCVNKFLRDEENERKQTERMR